MKEIGRANIEIEVIIQYIKGRIPDDQNNKIILYGTSNFEEFKIKVNLYEKMKARTKAETKYERKDFQGTKNKFRPNVQKSNEQKVQYIEVRCFSCGEKGHKSKS